MPGSPGNDPIMVNLWAQTEPTPSATEGLRSATPTLWESIENSDAVGIGSLGILVVFSVVSWAIIVQKALQLRRASASSADFLGKFWESKRLDQMYQSSQSFTHAPVCQLFRAGYAELNRLKKKASEEDFGEGIENVERALRRTQSAEVTRLESLTPFLATVGSTGPFIGLFGTVWGIMRAFRDIGAAGSANLATVAPGISEALIATAAGLAAAIPAVIAYNYFVSRLRVLETEMESFASDFLNIVKRHSLK
ncbi:MAG: protein TolQ [Myxococcota bacterium]